MKKNKVLGIGIGFIIIITSWIVFSDKINQLLSSEEIGVPQENIKQEVVLIIDNNEEGPKIFESEFKEGMTVFSLLKNKAEESDLVLKVKTYDFGTLVEVIGDKENGKDGKYWMYYVNGEMPMIAADKKAIKPGDEVEFKFEKSPF